MNSLSGLTLFITGASRGIGKAIALVAAQDGANVVVAAKTAKPHPILPGTIHQTVEVIEQAGGKALACEMDVRFAEQVRTAMEQAAERFGGIDVLVNNASAISLTPTLQTPAKRWDLMHQVNARGTFLCGQAAIPYLQNSSHAHILTLSPPLSLEPQWFAPHLAYTMSKYGMSMCTLGWSEELKAHRIGVNSLWPKTAIATAAVRNLFGGQEAVQRCRTPQIVADAAHAILTEDPSTTTGQFFIDEEVLRARGVKDFASYQVDPTQPLLPDLFV